MGNLLFVLQTHFFGRYEFVISSTNKAGFGREELIVEISNRYHRIYREEEESSTTKTIPIEERETLLNRNKTNGIYGIWGHDIEDLDLSRIIISRLDDGFVSLELIVES